MEYGFAHTSSGTLLINMSRKKWRLIMINKLGIGNKKSRRDKMPNKTEID